MHSLDMATAVRYLSESDAALQVLGAAYIQHQCYHSNDAKNQVLFPHLLYLCDYLYIWEIIWFFHFVCHLFITSTCSSVLVKSQCCRALVSFFLSGTCSARCSCSGSAFFQWQPSSAALRHWRHTKPHLWKLRKQGGTRKCRWGDESRQNPERTWRGAAKDHHR